MTDLPIPTPATPTTASVPSPRSKPIARATETWELDCANCDATFPTTAFEANAFCSSGCHTTARAIRYGRSKAARYGSSDTWRDELLLDAVGRLPQDAMLAEIDRRWNAARPLRACDDEGWNHTWLTWVSSNRRLRQ